MNELITKLIGTQKDIPAVDSLQEGFDEKLSVLDKELQEIVLTYVCTYPIRADLYAAGIHECTIAAETLNKVVRSCGKNPNDGVVALKMIQDAMTPYELDATYFLVYPAIEMFMRNMVADMKKKITTKSIYVIEMDSGLVKIGVSGKVKQRLRTLETQSGNKIINKWVSGSVDKNIASKIECACHKYFAKSRKDGEYFTIGFEEACQKAKKLFREVA